jgi:branched-chain amino acid aminotransferase
MNDGLNSRNPEILVDGVAYIDGAFCPIAEARIPVLDFGFLHSDATYDVVHVWKGRFFRLDWHLDRFLSSVEKLRLALPFDRHGLTDVLMECVGRSGHSDAYVEMICTRGVSPTYSRDPRDAVNRFIAFAIPFAWIADAEQRRRGLHLIVSSICRIPPQSVDPTVKNYHWLDLVKGQFEAYDRGGEIVVLTDGAGNVAEGPGFNIFVVKDGAVATPPGGVLEGITRKSVIALCSELSIPIDLRSVPVETLDHADEIFISSTAGGIMAVTTVEHAAIADGRPGPVTGRLHDLYWAKHADPDWTTAVDFQGLSG